MLANLLNPLIPPVLECILLATEQPNDVFFQFVGGGVCEKVRAICKKEMPGVYESYQYGLQTWAGQIHTFPQWREGSLDVVSGSFFKR